MGNMAFKGSIAVPLSRMCGALLQASGWDEEDGCVLYAEQFVVESCNVLSASCVDFA